LFFKTSDREIADTFAADLWKTMVSSDLDISSSPSIAARGSFWQTARFLPGRKIPSSLCYLTPILFLTWLMPACLSAQGTLEIEGILKKMNSAYAEVGDYQALVEVRNYQKDDSSESQEFLYTFKKPRWIRIDFESPHHGLTLVYPDSKGKVVVRLPILGWKLHLSPDNHLFKDPTGQRIDQTDMGRLIRNISHSLTDQRRGPVEITETDDKLSIRVLADDPFRRGEITLYRFLIDTVLWLPVGVRESTPKGQLERAIVFQHLKINPAIPENFFQLN
jgi:outer membrane lipoprotein-sorting protein